MNFASKLHNTDLVWQTIRDALPAKTRKSNRFIKFDCPMCVRRGHPRGDRRHRCNVTNDSKGVGIHCFNCGYKSLWKPGQLLSRNLRAFLDALGVDSRTIGLLNLRAKQINELNQQPTAVKPSFVPSFASAALPPDARPIDEWLADGCDEPDFLDTASYLLGRGDAIWQATTFYWTPQRAHDLNRRVIIPFHWKNKIVGWTARHIDDIAGIAKYHNGPSPANFLFNNRFIGGARRYVFLVEGIFDALAIDAVAAQRATLNPAQAEWLNNSGKIVVAVPDRDASGQRLIDLALHHRWKVSLPRQASLLALWHADIKDAAQAVQRYGKLYTVRSIIESIIDQPNKIRTYRALLTK